MKERKSRFEGMARTCRRGAPVIFVVVLFALMITPFSIADGSGRSADLPRISAISPRSGPCCARVTLSGSGFGPSRAGSYVELGGWRALRYWSWTSVRIVTMAPSGASGSVSVRVATTTGTSAPATFRVTPYISSLKPDSGREGESLTVEGSGFGASRAGSYVTFGTSKASAYSRWSGTRLKVKVPRGLPEGTTYVKVVTSGGRSNAARFTTPPRSFPGGWSWVQDPRAVRFRGVHDRTYFGWVTFGASARVEIAYYDHDTGSYGGPVTVQDGWQSDDHCAPAILVLPDGRLMVFYSKHNRDYMRLRRSENPEDITSWEEVRVVSGTDASCCYAHPVRLENGDIYLVYRNSETGNDDWVSSHDEGVTWSEPEVLVDFRELGRYGTPYLKLGSGGGALHIGVSGCCHNVDGTYKNVYHAFFDGSAWRKIDGTVLTLPLTPRNMDVAFESGPNESWIWDAAVDAAGYPVLALADRLRTDDIEYWTARWDGREWVHEKVADSCHGGLFESQDGYAGGICLDHGQPSKAFAAVYVGGRFELKEYQRREAGWVRVSDVTRGSATWNTRPVVPLGGQGSELLWMQGKYSSYTDLNTAIRFRH